MPSSPPPAPVVILSCSLNVHSRSHQLALAADAFLLQRGFPVEVVDLGGLDLPLCGGPGSFDHPDAAALNARIEAAAAILVASPVYNYDLNAAAKNAMELTGSAWRDKPVGFLCAAGGRKSYMAPMGFANSLMFDFRCLIVPRFVYGAKDDFDPDGAPGPELARRVEQLAAAVVDLARGLAWARANPVG